MAVQPPKIKSLDHLVLTVASISTTIDWYTYHLGMTHETFTSEDGAKRNALLFGTQKINLHKSGAEFEPKATHVQPGSADLCFLTETPIDDVLLYLKKEGIEVLEGGEVVQRQGAVSALRSVYVRDPSGNLVEISNKI